MFAEFPDGSELTNFDNNDRKFVAAASEASRLGATRLVNALDRDYEEHRTALDAAGINVDELCPQHINTPDP